MELVSGRREAGAKLPRMLDPRRGAGTSGRLEARVEGGTLNLRLGEQLE
jgi:hypothetical protein